MLVVYPQESWYPVEGGKIEVVKIQGGQVVTTREDIKEYRGKSVVLRALFEVGRPSL